MNIENKTVLVTGSTDGVGRLVARRLANQGARVLIHGRDRTRGEQLLKEIRTADHGSAAFLPADFSSLAEVRRLADTVRQECDRVDILINNAGIGSGGSAGKRETSQDGHELRFAVNYLAGFLLTRVLLPVVMLGKPARIVNVSSLGQHPIDFDDVMLTRGYSGSRAKANSAGRAGLTRRELEALAAMADGASNKAIARRLGISFHTAKFHVAAILAKLDADSRTEAVAKAAQLGLVML
jgi:NAD(P)-dependent dehydrogenase (short-subunit alcohol dehydrogenase family)